MAIPDSDPRAVELDAAFEAAMAGPAKPRSEAKTPAEVDHDAPFGRSDDGQAIAPYGVNKDGKPKRSAGGRPPKHGQDAARTASPADLKPPGDGQPGSAKPEPHDYSDDLQGLATAAWFGLSGIAKVGGNIPFLKKLVPEQKLAAQAFIISETSPQLVGAVNLAAQHNAKAAKFCQGLQGGNGLWALQAMFMVMPVVSLSLTVWKGDEAKLKEAELPTLAEMAKRNEGKMDEMLASINAQIAAATVVQMQPEAAPAAG